MGYEKLFPVDILFSNPPVTLKDQQFIKTGKQVAEIAFIIQTE